jgi:peptidoglycan/xylan/chitin deacetylase (PgdA/CDA1 family)
LWIPFLAHQEMDLSSTSGREAARMIIHRRLLEVGHDERAQLLKEIEHQLRPDGQVPRLTMNWDDVRDLCSRYPFIEIGGHTRDHIDLSTHCGETARFQIAGCAADLRRELGVEPRHFSFPYGRWSAETRGIVRAAGWHSAVGDGDDRRVGRTSDRFVIPRVDAPRTMTDLRFKTSGAYPGIFSMLGMRRGE